MGTEGGCAAIDATTLHCPRHGPEKLHIAVGAGDDRVHVSSTANMSTYVWLELGPGGALPVRAEAGTALRFVLISGRPIYRGNG